MRLRETAGRGRLVAAAAAALLAASAGCGSTTSAGDPVPIREARTPESLSAILESIASRKDPEACEARARIYSRLREFGGTNARIWRAKGDSADIDVLSQPAPPELKAESAARLARHFLERTKAGTSTGPFRGPQAELLQRLLLLIVAERFGDCASGSGTLHAEVLDELSAVAERLAGREDVRPEIRKLWAEQAKSCGLHATELRGAEERPEVAPESRKFCESDLARHLEEATRAADRGTAEKAGRGDPARVLEWYLASLTHFTLARECLVDPTPTQEHALAGMEMVGQSVANLIRREP